MFHIYTIFKEYLIYIFSKMPGSIKKIMMNDGIGFVELLEVFGNDLTVVNAARVSFDKESKEMNMNDEKLINYLAKHQHITPFFHPQARFRINMPIFCCREYFRHNIGLSRNEVSRRYVDSIPECYIPAPEDIRERNKNLKQGSKETPIENSEEVHNIFKKHTEQTIECYTTLLQNNVAPEVARIILGQNMYSSFIETGSISAYARICNLRLDPSAQKEIQDYAKAIDQLMSEAFPVSWKALSNNFKHHIETTSQSS
jgi:thymidylate synthase (FAD)